MLVVTEAETLVMEGMLRQTHASAEPFTEFGPSAYVHDQPTLETLDVTMEQREVRRRLRALRCRLQPPGVLSPDRACHGIPG